MDLMRTLLIYMSATLMLAVQSTSAPQATPTPSPAPEATAAVEVIGTPATGEEGGKAGETGAPATAAPTAAGNKGIGKYTPVPLPEITPNNKAYYNLTTKSRGKDVKKLQERLIELGYLPAGSADGAYGRQTANAVKLFQYYNGLTTDGIAGRKTQTYLYEHPDVARNPEAEPQDPIPTPAPETETPAPETETPVPETPTPEPETPTPEPETPTPEPETPTPEPETPTPEPETPTPEPETPTPEPETPTPEPETPTPEPETPTPEPETPTPEPETPTPEPETPTPEPETPAPEATEAPEETGQPGEIEENVDLDADVYEPIFALVALNEGDGPLEFLTTEDGVPVTARPRLTQNGSRIRISLDDLCACVEGWQLTDDGVGSVVVEAAGYTLALYNEDHGCSATVDGTEVAMREDDFDFAEEGHFINAEFLAAALKGEAVWDQEENTLMLRIRDKDTSETDD